MRLPRAVPHCLGTECWALSAPHSPLHSGPCGSVPFATPYPFAWPFLIVGRDAFSMQQPRWQSISNAEEARQHTKAVVRSSVQFGSCQAVCLLGLAVVVTGLLIAKQDEEREREKLQLLLFSERERKATARCQIRLIPLVRSLVHVTYMRAK